MRIDGVYGNGKIYSKCKVKDQDFNNGISDYYKSLEMMGKGGYFQMLILNFIMC